MVPVLPGRAGPAAADLLSNGEALNEGSKSVGGPGFCLCFGVSFYKKVIYGEGDKVEGCPAGRMEAEVLERSV